MNTVTLAIASVALAASMGASALAQPNRAAFASDVDYLRASRCRGIAEGVGADGATLAAYLKQQEVGRAGYIVARGQDERTRAKRQAKGYGRAQAEAELAGGCQAFTGAQNVAAQANPTKG
jgi:hypothetical protein